ncbi:hypothetical protein AgCh_032124 [Apium graveolens]
MLTILVDSLSCQCRNSSQPFSNTAVMDVLGSSDGTVRIWEIDTGRCLKIWELEEAVNYVAWNPSPKLPILAVGKGAPTVSWTQDDICHNCNIIFLAHRRTCNDLVVSMMLGLLDVFCG